MTELSAWLHGMLHGRVEPVFYVQHAQEIQMANQRTARYVSALGALLLFLCYGLGHIFPALHTAPALQLGFAIAFAAAALCIWLFMPRRPAHGGTAVLYLLVATGELCAMLLGTVYTPDNPAVAFFTVSVVLCALVLDKPWRVALFAAVSIVCFAMLSWRCKAAVPSAWQNDLFNSMYILLLCGAFCCYVINLRLQNLRAVELFRARSETDGLTGLSNREAMQELCRSYLASPRRKACALIMLDIDDFKAINDTLGHAVGDEVLYSVGVALRAVFRQQDYVARFGGDEFLVLMKDIDDPAIAYTKADQLRLRLADILPGGQALACSLGVASIAPGQQLSFELLFTRADTALYASKQNGKDRCTIYTSPVAAAQP